jgi:4-amino-4-deoxychorismate lyase
MVPLRVWVDGRRTGRIDVRDRGLQYGDGLFETMRVRDGGVRLLDLHLDRLARGCARLGIRPPPERSLRRQLARAAAGEADAVLKLIVTRGVGARGYRPTGEERTTTVLSLHPPAPAPPRAAHLRLCALRLGAGAALAGLKTLNRLEQVLARGEWHDPKVFEGLLCDIEGRVVCGTSSNVFLRRGSLLLTPRLDRCGVAGVMRRWVMDEAPPLGFRMREARVRVRDLEGAEELFVTNAIAGVVSAASLTVGGRRLRWSSRAAGQALRARLARL